MSTLVRVQKLLGLLKGLTGFLELVLRIFQLCEWDFLVIWLQGSRAANLTVSPKIYSFWTFPISFCKFRAIRCGEKVVI